MSEQNNNSNNGFEKDENNISNTEFDVLDDNNNSKVIKAQPEDLQDPLWQTLVPDSTETSDMPKSGKKKKQNKKKKVLISVLLAILAVLVAVAITTVTLVVTGRNDLLKHTNGAATMNNNGAANDFGGEMSKEVIVDGQKYVYNKNVTSILCMGIDRDNFSNKTTYGTNGQADAVFLVAVDTGTGKTTLISISRDAMVDINLYSEEGKYIGTEKNQLCLAYAYGDGKKTSCENTALAVSRLFYGLSMDAYFTIDMKAIPVLIKNIGYLNVKLTNSVTLDSVKYNAGQTVTLTESNTQRFLQQRDHIDINASTQRMENQKLFLKSYAARAISETKKDITFPINVYKSLSPYTITDLSVADVSFLTTCFIGKKNNGIEFKSVEGTMSKPGDYAEFNVDSEALKKLILEVFYTKQ